MRTRQLAWLPMAAFGACSLSAVQAFHNAIPPSSRLLRQIPAYPSRDVALSPAADTSTLRVSLPRSSRRESRVSGSLMRLRAGNSNAADGDKPRRWRKNNPVTKIVTKLVKSLVAYQSRTATRFQRLSKKAKRLVLMQLVVMGCLFGGAARNVQQQRHGVSPAPIEIAYSSFLDLVEQQDAAAAKVGKTGEPQSSSSSSSQPVVVMDQVRIGTDRISYRLHRPAAAATTSPPAEEVATLPRQRFALRGRKKPKLRQSPAVWRAYTRKVPASPELMHTLRRNKITFAALTQPRQSALAMTARTLMVGFYFLILWRLYGTVSKAGGNSDKDVPGKLAQTSDLPMATFDEIQGIDDAKLEVMELVDTLRNPDKYAILGARAPTGLLLEGPPGVGKTLLARATAASAGVPLLYCSGSDFVEMFVGRGAARVRKLFERASKLSPCLIFIDELDALGKSRDMGGMGGGFGRSNDEAEQTLNQLLACMDGLDSSRRVCVMAATNRKDVLDQALVRPGRFDRIVSLKLPNAAGREKILRVHCRKLPGFTEIQGVDPQVPNSLGVGRRVDLSALAAVTDGLSGAELEFLVNEAAIRAVRRVSAALQQGTSSLDIVPHVESADFESSLASFFATRRSKGAAGNAGEILKNLWK